MPSAVDKFLLESQTMGIQYQKTPPYPTEGMWNIAYLPYVQNKEY